MSWASKTIGDQNVNIQTEWIKWGSNMSLKAVLFQIKVFLILARELKSRFISLQSNKYEKAENSNRQSLLCLL